MNEERRIWAFIYMAPRQPTIRAIFSGPEPSDGFESFPASANRKHSSGLTLDEREPPVDGRHSEEKVRTNLGPSYPAGASPKAD